MALTSKVWTILGLAATFYSTSSSALDCATADEVADHPNSVRRLLASDVLAHARVVEVRGDRIHLKIIERFRGPNDTVELQVEKSPLPLKEGRTLYEVGDIGVFSASDGRIYACNRLDATPKLMKALRSAAKMKMRSNNALERTVKDRGALCHCESASCPAAQLGR